MKNRIILYSILTLLIVLIGNNQVYALSQNNDSDNLDYVLDNTSLYDLTIENGKIIYSNEYISLMEEKNAQLEKSYQKYLNSQSLNVNVISLQSISGGVSTNGFCYSNRTLSVQTFQQETSYWCGPASVKETLQFINGSSLSQSQYASNMSTNSTEGTYVYRVTNELNARQSRHTYAHETGVSATKFNTIIISDILDSDVGVPFILHAITGSLYMYNGTNINHYLVVNGANMITQTVTYIDSYANNYGRGTTLGQHTDSRSNVYNTINIANRFIIW